VKLAFQEELCSRILWVKNSQTVSPREFVRKVDPSKIVHETTHLPGGAWFQDSMVKNSPAVSPREFVRKVDTSKFVHEASHLPGGAWLQDCLGSNTLNQFPQGSL